MKKLFPVLKFILFLSIAAGLMYLALRGIDMKDLYAALWDAHYGYVLLSLIPAMLAFASRAWRWKMLLHPLGYKPKFNNTFYALMFGYLANLALPRLGEVSRSVALNRAEKIPIDVALGTVLAERAIDVLSLILCIVLAFILEFENIYRFLKVKLIEPLPIKMYQLVHSDYFIPVLVAVAAIVIFTVLILRKRKTASSFREKIVLFFKGILAGLISVTKVKNRGAFIFHSVFIWVMYWLVTYICFFSVKATSSLDMSEGVFILVVGAIGMTIPVPGGFGSYHALVVLGLAMCNIHDSSAANSYALIVHESQTLVVILVGTISFLLLSRIKKQLPANVNT